MPPLPVAVLLALACGVLLVLAFPSTGLWFLAPVAVAALTLATRGRPARTGFVLGLLAGLAFFLPHLHWSGVYVGVLPWAALATLEALFVAALGALLPFAWKAPGGGVGTVVTVTGLWVADEALRGREPFGGFPWGRLAFSQADGPMLALARFGGAPLVSAAVAASGALLAVAVVSGLRARGRRAGGAAADARRPRTRAAGALAAALAVVVAPLLLPGPPAAVGYTQVAAVQGNVPAAGLEFNAQRRAVLDNHVAATLALAARVRAGTVAAPDLVLWPENASDIDPLRNPDAAQQIARAADAVGVPLLVGAVLEEPQGRLSNAAIVWGPDGTAGAGPGQRYVKRHPAPFAEYIPYRSFFRAVSSKVDLVRKDFVAGRSVGLLQMGGVRVGDVICFEVAYDGLVRDPVRAGADLLVVQTNNATFGYTDESVQQLAMSRLRAVETGRSVVHISTVGVSGLIDADGRVLARSSHFTQETLVARLPLRTAITPAVRLGAWPEGLIAALGLVLVAAAILRSRRRTPHRRAPVPGSPWDPVAAAGPALRREPVRGAALTEERP